MGTTLVCDLIVNLRKQQAFKIDKEKQIVFYQGHRFYCGSEHTWHFILMLFNHKNTPVNYENICNKLWSTSSKEYRQGHIEFDRRLQKTVNDVRSYLKKNNLPTLAKAITDQRQ